MVGIVIVSHSAKLAGGIAELALQMAQNPVSIAIAAGIENPDDSEDANNFLGTDPLKICEAISSVYSEDGVVVLMDLGSAILSTEMALDFLSEEEKNKIKLCSAPIVEGTIAAVVRASIGGNLEEVIHEATTALNPKISQLNTAENSSNYLTEVEAKETNQNLSFSAKKIQITIKNKQGIHARPAAKIVTTAAQFTSEITIQNLTTNSQIINAKSINQVITLGILQGHQIEISASGMDADEALNALNKLAQNNFGELIEENLEENLEERLEKTINKKNTPEINQSQINKLNPNISNDISNYIKANPASPGIAVGKAIYYQREFPEIINETIDNPSEEWQKLQQAIQISKQEIQALITNDNTGVFQAHLLFLEDPNILTQTHQLIFKENFCAAFAWQTVIKDLIITYENLSQPYLKARAIDIKDIGNRVLSYLIKPSISLLNLTESGIIIANELTPSEVSKFNQNNQDNQVLGICLINGNSTSHSILIAKMLGIPAIVNTPVELLQLTSETFLGLNGETGEIWVNPDEKQIQELQQKSTPKINKTHQENRTLPITKDGKNINIKANIISKKDAKLAIESGAKGIGLLRTELLYLDNLTPPTEAQQIEIYQGIASVLKGYPLTIRSLDIGGDKPLPFLDMPTETNPFLGWRGIRQSLECLDLFTTQLRAILKASDGHNFRVMFPMVTSVEEVHQAKGILNRIKEELRAENLPFQEDIKVGIMIETPAAVTMSDCLAKEVDFFSIGTNDLSQYMMAADRTNTKVSKLADGFSPAILRSIAKTITQAHNFNTSVSVCGELASESLAIPILLGLGVDELSVNPISINFITEVISQLKMVDCQEMASYILKLDSINAVREELSKFIYS